MDEKLWTALNANSLAAFNRFAEEANITQRMLSAATPPWSEAKKNELWAQRGKESEALSEYLDVRHRMFIAAQLSG